MSLTSKGEVHIDDKYVVLNSIGHGHFGEIRLARHIETNNYFAVKIEDVSKSSNKLENEMKIYEIIRKKFLQAISDSKKNGIEYQEIYGFPMVIQFGKLDNFNYLIMELLSHNLETLFNVCNRKFTLKCITMIGIQILNRLEFIHSCNIIFRDVKPENFVIGNESFNHGNIIYMLDFGLSKDRNEPVPITSKSKLPPIRKVLGTSRYMSINAHRGSEQSQRDDLESLAYILIYFAKGVLPWQGIVAEDIQHKFKRIMEIKLSTQTSTLCKGLAIQFEKFLGYIKLLDNEQKPNYGHLVGLLYELLDSVSEVCDWNFDWNGVRSLKHTSESSTTLMNNRQSMKTNDMYSSNSSIECVCCGMKKSRS